MTITVDLAGAREKIRDRYIQVVDDAFAALTDDLRNNGPRSDEHVVTDSAPDHMVEILDLTEADDGVTRISRTIRSPADYSSYVDEGTPPHRIEGKPLLAFTASDGTKVVVRYVNHPGTPRTGWWSDPTGRFRDYLDAAMR